ncbi:nucleoside diphosphate kinase [Platysternon megacephalum]|uniref:Nucleoside diphosphate kinase n=1 Tax=Platysternon megacephalum TaxID=55544 RepID=A0A4D9DLZ5_9SAUR|nr:nucleoside diphosphate kinase [Platysternon megacephalum]
MSCAHSQPPMPHGAWQGRGPQMASLHGGLGLTCGVSPNPRVTPGCWTWLGLGEREAGTWHPSGMSRLPGYHEGLTLPAAGTEPQQWGFETGRISVSLTREPGFRLGHPSPTQPIAPGSAHSPRTAACATAETLVCNGNMPEAITRFQSEHLAARDGGSS